MSIAQTNSESARNDRVEIANAETESNRESEFEPTPVFVDGADEDEAEHGDEGEAAAHEAGVDAPAGVCPIGKRSPYTLEALVEAFWRIKRLSDGSSELELPDGDFELAAGLAKELRRWAALQLPGGKITMFEESERGELGYWYRYDREGFARTLKRDFVDRLPTEATDWETASTSVDGKPTPIKTILERLLFQVKGHRLSYVIPASFPNIYTGVFWEAACPLRRLSPRYDENIQRWLELLGGDKKEKLLDWVATVTCLDRPTCGLFLSGKTSTGKTVLSNGLSRLWSTGDAVSLQAAVSPFNSEVRKNPVWAAHEELPTVDGRTISTEKLRELISAESHAYRRKHQDETVIEGCIRLILTANRDTLLSDGDESLGADALEAVAGRFLHIPVCDAAAEFITSIGGRDGGTKDWVDGDLIARHALWLRDNRSVIPGKRFLVEGELSATHLLLATQGSAAEAVLEAIVDTLSAEKWTLPPMTVVVGNGQLLVNSDKLSAHLKGVRKPGDRQAPKRKDVAKALGNLGTREKPTIGGKQMRMWSVDPAKVVAWAENYEIGDPDWIKKMINGPTVTSASDAAKAAQSTGGAN